MPALVSGMVVKEDIENELVEDDMAGGRGGGRRRQSRRQTFNRSSNRGNQESEERERQKAAVACSESPKCCCRVVLPSHFTSSISQVRFIERSTTALLQYRSTFRSHPAHTSVLRRTTSHSTLVIVRAKGSALPCSACLYSGLYPPVSIDCLFLSHCTSQ